MPSSEDGIVPIKALDIALDERDTVTHGHCDRVSGLALALGRHLGLTDIDLHSLTLAAHLHDIGKIGIPDVILKKPGRLTETEWVVMRSHSVRSARIVAGSNLEHADQIGMAVRHHHEHHDGHGYPDGLSGEAIPLLSRIIAIVDTYDAMARLRAYGPVVPHRDIMRELARVSGTQHDPHFSKKFTEIIEASPFKAN